MAKKTASETSAAKDSAKEAVSYPVLNLKGEEVGTVSLDGEIFAASQSEALVFDTVMWQRNRKRAGTHKSLTKGEMKGGGQKPWRQKGTGRARAGTSRSPLWVGGGTAHGPKPHDYETRVPKRTRRQAMAAVLSDKVQSKRLIVVDAFSVKEGKTREVAKAMSALKVGNQTVSLLVKSAATDDANLLRAARNVKGLTAIDVKGLNVYDLLRNNFLVASRDSLLELQTALKSRSGNVQA